MTEPAALGGNGEALGDGRVGFWAATAFCPVRTNANNIAIPNIESLIN
jgi:hypothetical protein